MLQKTCTTLGFKKVMAFKIPSGGVKKYQASGLLRYISYLNFTEDHIKHVNSVILVLLLNLKNIDIMSHCYCKIIN